MCNNCLHKNVPPSCQYLIVAALAAIIASNLCRSVSVSFTHLHTRTELLACCLQSVSVNLLLENKSPPKLLYSCRLNN